MTRTRCTAAPVDPERDRPKLGDAEPQRAHRHRYRRTMVIVGAFVGTGLLGIGIISDFHTRSELRQARTVANGHAGRI